VPGSGEARLWKGGRGPARKARGYAHEAGHAEPARTGRARAPRPGWARTGGTSFGLGAREPTTMRLAALGLPPALPCEESLAAGGLESYIYQ
jgi:hypothetical protein